MVKKKTPIRSSANQNGNWKAQLFRVTSRVKTQNLDPPQADKDEEPKNMLARCKVIQTLGGQFGSFSQGTMCSYQMIFQSSSLKNPQSCWVLPCTQNILHMTIYSVFNDTAFLSTLPLMHPTMSKRGVSIFFIHFNYSYFKYFNYSYWFLTSHVLELCYFTPKYMGSFRSLIIVEFFHFTEFWKHTLGGFYSLICIRLCFMLQKNVTLWYMLFHINSKVVNIFVLLHRAFPHVIWKIWVIVWMGVSRANVSFLSHWGPLIKSLSLFNPSLTKVPFCLF